MCVPSSLFRMPCGSKMTTHSLEVTAVGIAHGIRMAARTMAAAAEGLVHHQREAPCR